MGKEFLKEIISTREIFHGKFALRSGRFIAAALRVIRPPEQLLKKSPMNFGILKKEGITAGLLHTPEKFIIIPFHLH